MADPSQARQAQRRFFFLLIYLRTNIHILTFISGIFQIKKKKIQRVGLRVVVFNRIQILFLMLKGHCVCACTALK